MIRSFPFLLALLAAPFFAAGCGTPIQFSYPVFEVEVANPDPPDASIAVLPAFDRRGREFDARTKDLYRIPLMPWGWIAYDRPENASTLLTVSHYGLHMTTDVPRVIAEHWQAAGVAREVYFDEGYNLDRADYFLTTTIRRTHYHGRLFSYGLAFLGPLLWVFGAPLGHASLDLALDLELKNRDLEVVWSDAIEVRDTMLHGYYFNFGRDMDLFARSLQTGLERSLRENPVTLNPEREP